MRSYYPKSSYAPKSLLLEADDPSGAGKAIRLYDEILSKYPVSEEAATILEKRGQQAFDRKDYKGAQENWKRFVEGFPNHAHLTEVQKKLETVELVLGGNEIGNRQSAIGIQQLEAESLVKRADALFDRASFSEAARLYEQVLQKDARSKEGAHAAGRLAQCRQMMGKDQEAFATLQRMTEKNPEGAPQALGEIVVRAANKNMGALRQRATQQLLDRYPNTFEAQQAMFIAGSEAMSRKNRTEAQKWWNGLLEKYPETEFREAVEKELGFVKDPEARSQKPEAGKKPSSQQAREEKQTREKQLAEDRKRWEREAWEFEKIYRNVESSPEQKAEAAFQWAERCFCLEQAEKVVQQYQRVWEEFPVSRRAKEAAFRAAQVWFNSAQPRKGVEQFLFFINRFPKSDDRPIALYCLGNRHILYEGNLDKAWCHYEQLIREYPQHPLTDAARKFWARVKGLSKQKLKEQVADFVKKKNGGKRS